MATVDVTKATNDDILNGIKIAAPCSERWETMPGGERVRSCARCQHKVYNLSEMSAAEAADLVRNAEGRVCVRLYRRADGSVMTQDCPTGLRAARRRVVRAAGVVFASPLSALGLFSLAERMHQRAAEPVMGDMMPVVQPTPSMPVMGTPAPTIPDPTIAEQSQVMIMTNPPVVMGKIARPAMPLPMAPTSDPDKTTFLPHETPSITRDDPFAPLPKAQRANSVEAGKASRL